jgi:SAM-dependent methyltransferase
VTARGLPRFVAGKDEPMTEERKAADTYFDHLGKAEAPTGFGAWLTRRAARRIHAFVQVPAGGCVLEIGPGRGDLADLFLIGGVDYHAVEANRRLATALEQRGARVRCAIAPPLPPFEERFDRALMVNVMEHMSNMEQALEIARQVRDLLKPGGRFVIHSPDYLSWRSHFFNCDFSHNFVTTRRRLTQLLINAGYDDIESAYMSGPFRGCGAVVLAAFASRSPFGMLAALFGDTGWIGKLYKLQLTFSRRVLISGRAPERTE